MSKTNAEYMRQYRARKKLAQATGRLLSMPPDGEPGQVLVTRDGKLVWEDAPVDRIAELEAEVKHLKAELAKRVPAPHSHDQRYVLPTTGDPFKDFHPVEYRPAPKPVKHR